MKEITLLVTPNQEKWLKHFAKFQKEGSRDNLGTYKPLHLVQTQDEVLDERGQKNEKIKWRTVSYHFTLQSAKDYIQYQRHNLTQPRTYTVAPGYSNNGDYEPFFDFLMAAGTALLESEKEENTPESECEQNTYFPDVDYVDSEWGIGKSREA